MPRLIFLPMPPRLGQHFKVEEGWIPRLDAIRAGSIECIAL